MKNRTSYKYLSSGSINNLFKVAMNMTGDNKGVTLTDTERSLAREWLGAASSSQIGDIETALDSIIAIQNSILGGNA